jgi:hypothetical protein
MPQRFFLLLGGASSMRQKPGAQSFCVVNQVNTRRQFELLIDAESQFVDQPDQLGRQSWVIPELMQEVDGAAALHWDAASREVLACRQAGGPAGADTRLALVAAEASQLRLVEFRPDLSRPVHALIISLAL